MGSSSGLSFYFVCFGLLQSLLGNVILRTHVWDIMVLVYYFLVIDAHVNRCHYWNSQFVGWRIRHSIQ